MPYRLGKGALRKVELSKIRASSSPCRYPWQHCYQQSPGTVILAESVEILITHTCIFTVSCEREAG